MTLRQRMLLVLAIAALPGIVVAVILTVHKFAEESEQIETSVVRLAKLGAAQHQAVITNGRTLVASVVRAGQPERIREADCSLYDPDWGDRLTFFTSMALFDEDGQVVCANTDGELPETVAGQAWFKTAKEEKRFALSDYTLGRTGEPLLIAGSPVVAADDSVIGVAAIGISLTWLDFMTGRIELPPEGTITALGPDGQILSHRGANDRDPAPPPSEYALQLMRMERSETLRATDSSGSTRLYGFEETEAGGVLIIVGLPQFVEYTEWGNALIDTLILPLSVLLLALAAAGWASEAFVTRHVRSLISTTDRIAGGELSARSQVDYDEHEIGELAAAMDGMAEAIESSHASLKQRLSDSELIAGEMRHRFANNLTLVQAIARQTSQHSRTTEEFYDDFSARLEALAASNHILAKQDWKGANLRELLHSVLAPHAPPDRSVFDLNGPDTQLDGRSAMALSMCVHELATNAVKFGALSKPGGTATIRWSITDQDSAHWLTLEWREAGGPEPGEPDDPGFGSKLLEIMIERTLGGKVSRAFEPGGLICELSFPLKRTAKGE